jgi:hypothetical protein
MAHPICAKPRHDDAMADLHDPYRAERTRGFELEAEWLAVEQLDLLSQVEAQLRVVRQTMVQIETLRGVKYRVGPELSNAKRGDALEALSGALIGVNEQVTSQGTCCRDMLATVDKMQHRLLELVRAAKQGQLELASHDQTHHKDDPYVPVVR